MVELDTNSPSTEELTDSLDALTDPGLCQLKEQIKHVMIPLLIRVFQLRREVQQASSLPSRLLDLKPKTSLDELKKQLQQLDQDLALLQVWNQSCRSQIEKVLLEANEIPALRSSIQTKHQALPSIQKSFQNTILSGQNKEFIVTSKTPWWRKWFFKGTS